MPIYEFECPEHGHFERIFKLSELDRVNKHGVFCGQILSMNSDFIVGEEFYCKYICQKIWSVPAKTNLGKATKVFRNPKTGDVKVANFANQKPPKGYVSEEIQGQSARLKLEKRLNHHQQIENSIISENAEQAKEATRKERHADLRAGMNNFDSHSQQLVKLAMERTNKKPFRKKKSEIRMAINHTDSSNLNK